MHFRIVSLVILILSITVGRSFGTLVVQDWDEGSNAGFLESPQDLVIDSGTLITTLSLEGTVGDSGDSTDSVSIDSIEAGSSGATMAMSALTQLLPKDELPVVHATRLTGATAQAEDPADSSIISVPEPATLTMWGLGSLALAAAAYRRRKRGGRTSRRVQRAVAAYLDADETSNEHFRRLGSHLTTLADDPTWTKQEIEEFYDEVVLAIHSRHDLSEVA